MVNNVIVLIVMSVTGLFVGWRIRGSFGDAALGYLILLIFAYAISWVMAWVGLLVPSVEVFNQAFLVVIFPLTVLVGYSLDGDAAFVDGGVATLAEQDQLASKSLM